MHFTQQLEHTCSRLRTGVLRIQEVALVNLLVGGGGAPKEYLVRIRRNSRGGEGHSNPLVKDPVRRASGVLSGWSFPTSWSTSPAPGGVLCLQT